MVNICHSYKRMYSGTVFLTHGVEKMSIARHCNLKAARRRASRSGLIGQSEHAVAVTVCYD